MPTNMPPKCVLNWPHRTLLVSGSRSGRGAEEFSRAQLHRSTSQSRRGPWLRMAPELFKGDRNTSS